MGRKPSDVSDAEMDILRVLWEQGPATVRDVGERLTSKQGSRKQRWAYTTIQTLLGRLEAKGYVKADKSNLAHVFKPMMTRDRFLSQRLRTLSNEVCDGTAAPLMMALVRGMRFSPEEIQEFRRLIDDLDREQE